MLEELGVVEITTLFKRFLSEKIDLRSGRGYAFVVDIMPQSASQGFSNIEIGICGVLDSIGEIDLPPSTCVPDIEARYAIPVAVNRLFETQEPVGLYFRRFPRFGSPSTTPKLEICVSIDPTETFNL